MFQKLRYFFQIIKANGGIKGSFYKMYRFDTLKEGCMVGWDEFGNRYYENQRYTIGTCRWVEYAEHFQWEYEGTQVPCCDFIKNSIRRDDCYGRWLLDHEENMSGTVRAYYPYSTTRQHVCVWNGGSVGSIPCPTPCD